MGKRTVYSPAYKAKVVIEVIRGEKQIGEIAAREGINPTMLARWRQEFEDNAARVFDENKREQELKRKEQELEHDRNELLRTVGQLTIERDWLKKKQLKHSDPITRRNAIGNDNELSIERQCELLEVNRSSVYYKPSQPRDERREFEDTIKGQLDFWHTKHPSFGVRKMRDVLRDEGYAVGRKRIRRYMNEMGIYAIYPKPNLSKRNQEHRVYPYLLRSMPIYLPNQVWSIDITYIKMRHGHMYLTAIIDWYSRYIVGWELSDTLETAPVLKALREAMEAYGTPGIINSDQGSQFTSEEYTTCLKAYAIRQSMDGKARWVDNVVIERWFRSLKWEDIYLNEYETPRALRMGIRKNVDDYNRERPHQSFNGMTPEKVYLLCFAAAA